MASFTSAFTGTEIDQAIGNANAMLLTGATDPTTATVGTLGQTYKNTTSGALFRCVTIAGAAYTWDPDYKKSEIDALLAAKAPQATTYTKTETYSKTEADTILGGKANQVDVDSTRLELSQTYDKVNDLSNTLSTININQSPTQTVTDYSRILSLPKNAANGNASVGLKGMTAQNLVSGANIAINGTVTWASVSGNKYFDKLNKAILTGTGSAMTATNASGVAANMLIVDLTTILLDSFTATMCEAAFPTWFDGTKSTKGRGRVKSVGKNLFDKNRFTQIAGYTSGSNIVLVSGYLTLYIKIKPSTAYTVSKVSSQRFFIGFTDDIPTSGSYITGVVTSGVATSATSTSAASSKYIVIYYYNKGVDTLSATTIKDSIQIEYGSTATTYEPYRSSEKYINATEDLRRVPSAYDELAQNTSGAMERIGRCKEYTLVASDVTNVEQMTTVAYALIQKPPNALCYNNTISSIDCISLEGFKNHGVDDDGCVYEISCRNVPLSNIVSLPLGTTLEQARAFLTGRKLIYQLATPVVTPIETSGTLLSYPSGSVYFEPITADCGYYTTSMVITATGFPIATLESVSKFNIATGVETVLDASTAVVAPNGLSFTHSGLVDGDIVFFTYEFKSDNPEGNKTVSYLDSRYVVADTTNGKFYQWKIATTNGVPSITAVEV